MRIALSTARQAHYKLLASAMVRRGHDFRLYTSTPASRLRGFPPETKVSFVPAPATLVNAVTRATIPQNLYDLDSAFYDRLTSYLVRDVDLVFGAASSSLYTAKATHRLGARFVLDRACPDIRVQQAFVKEEAKKIGFKFDGQAQWFVDRQVAEYEEADFIISPSNYSRSTFPESLRRKAVLVPLFGRAPVGSGDRPPRKDDVFTVGVVGGNPLRKGYLYLLQAWKELALPNAKLLIRSSGDLKRYPAIVKLLAELPNVSIIGYVPNLSDFYYQCDAFILPSIDDGFGMALFEALGHGVPSIATRNCGASELMTPGRDGLIIDAYSSEQIVENLRMLYESADLRDRLGTAGQRLVTSLQAGNYPKPYEEGIDRLFQALGVQQQSLSAHTV